MLQVFTLSASIHPGAAYQHNRFCHVAPPAPQITLAAMPGCSLPELHKEVEVVEAVEVQPCMCNSIRPQALEDTCTARLVVL